MGFVFRLFERSFRWQVSLFLFKPSKLGLESFTFALSFATLAAVVDTGGDHIGHGEQRHPQDEQSHPGPVKNRYKSWIFRRKEATGENRNPYEAKHRTRLHTASMPPSQMVTFTRLQIGGVIDFQPVLPMNADQPQGSRNEGQADSQRHPEIGIHTRCVGSRFVGGFEAEFLEVYQRQGFAAGTLGACLEDTIVRPSNRAVLPS